MTNDQIRVVFMGSPAFALPTLRAIHEAGFAIPLVVTQPDKRAGRGGKVTPPPVKSLANELGLDVYQPTSLRTGDVRDRIAAARPDVFVVAAYGKIIPAAILGVPSRGSLNVHASLLPRWRGASPINAAILHGDSETGVSIMEVVQQMDAGPVVSARSVPIGPEDTTASLEPRLADLGAELLVETLPAWFHREIDSIPQDESLVTYCSLIAKEDGFLSREMTATEAERAVRAYNPWPGAFVRYRDERLVIWKARVAPQQTETVPGHLHRVEKQPAIAFTHGLLVLEEVQRQGSRRISGADFLNGQRGDLPAGVDLR